MSVVSPPPPRQDEPEALIEEAWELTRRRRHRRFAAAVVLLVVMGVAVIVGVSQSGGQTPRGGGRGSSAAAPGAQFAGRVWYARSIANRLTPSPIVPRVMRAGQKAGPVPVVYFRTRTSYETWIGSDGSFRQRVVVLSESFASAAGRRRWRAAHQSLPWGLAVGTGSDGVDLGNGEFPAGLDSSQSDPGGSAVQHTSTVGAARQSAGSATCAVGSPARAYPTPGGGLRAKRPASCRRRGTARTPERQPRAAGVCGTR